MTVPSDPYNFTAGTPAVADQIDARFLPLYTALNGAIDTDNIASAVLDKVGVSSSVVRRGKSIITAEESSSATTYGFLTTPDRVQNVVLPTDGLLFVAFQGMWKESATNFARAAIFLGSNQLQIAQQGGPTNQETALTTGVDINEYQSIFTTSAGLVSLNATSGSAYTGDATTGQLIGSAASNIMQPVPTSYVGPTGGAAVIFAAAGTYDVGIKWRVTSGVNTVTAKNRKLWVWTMGF